MSSPSVISKASSGPVIESRVGVDKIKVGLAFPHMKDQSHPAAELEHDTFAGIAQWVDSVGRHEFEDIGGGAGSIKRYQPPAAMTAANQPLVGGGNLYVRYGRHRGAFRAWVEFNPDKAHLGELAFHFNLMLPQGFETLALWGYVYYCELFIDIYGVSFDQHCFLDPRLQTGCDSYYDQGTIYLGSRQGARSLTIYDKRRERANAGELSGVERLRIETKLRGSHSRIGELVDLPNPFLRLLVAERQQLMASVGPAAKRMAWYLNQDVPISTTYAQFDSLQRKQAVADLAAMTPPWWRPAELFGQFDPDWISILRHAGRTGESWLPAQAFGQGPPVQSIADGAAQVDHGEQM